MQIGKSFLIKNFMNSVWLVEPVYLNNMVNVIKTKINDPSIYMNLVKMKEESNEEKSPYTQLLGNGTAILNIEGILVPKCSWLDTMCGLVSTLDLINEFEVLEKSSIEKIVLYINSPGGTGVGIEELAEMINTSSKEVIAYTDEVAASASYLLASSAKKFYALPSAEIGSIGAYITIIKEKDAQVDYFIIGEGEGKLFGHPNIPVTESELSYFKGRVHESYEMINNAISKYRGIDIDTVKSTKSLSYQAISAPEWMVDGFMTPSGLNLI